MQADIFMGRSIRLRVQNCKSAGAKFQISKKGTLRGAAPKNPA